MVTLDVVETAVAVVAVVETVGAVGKVVVVQETAAVVAVLCLVYFLSVARKEVVCSQRLFQSEAFSPWGFLVDCHL